jgi:Zn-dependent protease
MEPSYIPIWFVVFLLSLSVHEAAHAWTASRFGDETGRHLGRVTLNPIPHVDIFGTILFPLMSLLSGSSLFFGWAKPVPVDSTQMRERRLGETLVALAGPASNLLLVALFFTLLKIFSSVPQLQAAAGDLARPVAIFFYFGLVTNITLAVFNLLPIPPLDGSHIMRNLLPGAAGETYANIPPMVGMMILFALMLTGLTGVIINPIRAFVERML